MQAVIPVEIEHVATDTNLWCTDCMLGTGVRVWFVATVGTRTSLRSSSVCAECGGREIEV